MDEMTLLEDFRAAVAPPGEMALARARTRLLDADASSWEYRRLRWPRLPGLRGRLALTGLAGLAAAAAAVAVTMAVTGSGGAAAPAGAPSPVVKEMAYRAAAAAAAGPAVAPGQWVYWQEKGYSAPEIGPVPNQVFQVWTTADATNTAYLSRGKVVLAPCGWVGKKPPVDGCQTIGHPAIRHTERGNELAGGVVGKIPVPYADLSSLPRDPVALDRYLASLPRGEWRPVPLFQFVVITDLLTTYVMPPALTAELYQALGNIPGVTVDRHAVDVAGRYGIGFKMAYSSDPGGPSRELILDPRTFALMGEQLLGGRGPGTNPDEVMTGTAILKSALVSGPGKLP